MDAMKTAGASGSVDPQNSNELEPVKTLVVACGGSGNLIAAYIKAYAEDDPAIKVIGGDVVKDPPAVVVKRNGVDVSVSLERDLEHVRTGVDMNMTAIWADSRAQHRHRTRTAEVIARSRTAPSSSVEIGTEARRQLGYAAFAWSRPEIEAVLERAVRQLGDVRLKDRAGNTIANAPMNVLFISGIAGGVGAGSVLPMIGLVKQVMERCGVPLHRSLMTLVAIGPSAFPATDLRLSNAFETLRDLERAQARGVVLCSNGLIERFGAPVHAVLMVGTATEHGKTLRTNEELFPLVARFCHAFIGSNIGVDAAAFANNQFPVLASATDKGELRMLGSPGFVQGEFDGQEVALRHGAARLASSLLPPWIAAVDADDAVQRESESASVSHMDDETILLTHAQSDDAGTPLLAPFDKELAGMWKRRQPKMRALSAELMRIDEMYRLRMKDAFAVAKERLHSATTAFTDTVSGHARTLVNHVGPSAALAVISAGLHRADAMLATLGEQRSALAEDVASVGAVAAELLAELEARLSKGGVYWRNRKQIQGTIETLTEFHALSFAFSLTEGAIDALAGARDRLLRWQSALSDLTNHMTLAAAALADEWAAYETQTRTPIDELVARPLAEWRDLRALFEESVGASWDTASDLASMAFRDEVGDLESWLHQNRGDIEQRAREAALPSFAKVASMTADDFIRWKCHRTGVSPDVALRNLLDLAPILYRYDRTKLPEDDSMFDGGFALFGVPDRDASVFTGTGLGVLVSTGDKSHISILRLKLGMPASALFDYERMRAAHLKVRERGDVVVDIYPELYGTPRSSRTGSGRPHREGGRRAG